MKKAFVFIFIVLTMLACSLVESVPNAAPEPSDTPVPDTSTPTVTLTNTPVPPTETPIPPTNTPTSTNTATTIVLPDTATPESEQSEVQNEEGSWLGYWEFLDLIKLFEDVEDLEPFMDSFVLGGFFDFAEDNTYQFRINMSVDYQQMFIDMGMSEDSFSLNSNVFDFTFDNTGTYQVLDTYMMTMSTDDVDVTIDPPELCLSMAGQETCMEEEEMMESFNMDDFGFDESGITYFIIDGDDMVMWSEDCAGPEESCAMNLVRK